MRFEALGRMTQTFTGGTLYQRTLLPWFHVLCCVVVPLTMD